jgi:predicted nucleic acid-binding protein
MKKVFADTSYWIAIVNPRDQLHGRALRVTQRLSMVRVLTSEMVLVEFLNSFSDAGPLREVVSNVVHGLRQNRDVKIVPQTSAQFESALRLYRRAADKSWSLTDCASFRAMESEGIESALTYDQHFVQAGFEALLR